MKVYTTYNINLNENKCSDRSSASLLQCFVGVTTVKIVEHVHLVMAFQRVKAGAMDFVNGFKITGQTLNVLVKTVCLPVASQWYLFISFYTKFHLSHCRMLRSRQISIKRWLKKQRKKQKKRRKRKKEKVGAFGFNFLLLFYFFLFT